jgi:hypothetical protein
MYGEFSREKKTAIPSKQAIKPLGDRNQAVTTNKAICEAALKEVVVEADMNRNGSQPLLFLC